MSVRWSFKSNLWEPTRAQLLQISSIIQPEEKARIARFHFMKDAKSSLIGRLLIRKLVNLKTGTANSEIKLARDNHNKPILMSPKLSSTDATSNENAQHNSPDNDNSNQQSNPESTNSLTNLNFNVSHQGKFVVLVSEPSATQVGIDVMNIEKPGRITDSVDDYFRLMNRQFTEDEWKQIKMVNSSVPSYFQNRAKLTNFTRFWCLKEAYVKAVGVGIVIDLRSIDFTTNSDISTRLVVDTTIKVDGKSSPEWKFEERFIDDVHIVTVARCHSSEVSGSELLASVPEYELVSLDFLLEGMDSLGTEDHEWVDSFLKKK